MPIAPNALCSIQGAFRFLRRIPLLFCLLAGTMSLVFTGCNRAEKRADLVILNGAEPESLDPAIVTGQAEMRLGLALFEGLARFDPRTGLAVPAIADSWEKS